MAAADRDSWEADELDEGPSETDVERFSGEHAYCPDCGAEVFDVVDVCPKCYAFIGGSTSSRPPVNAWQRKRMILFVLIVVLIGFTLLALRGLIF